MRFDYPEIGKAIAIHDVPFHEFGDGMGMRDAGTLAKALVRQQLGCYDSLIEEPVASGLMQLIFGDYIPK